MGGLLWPSRQQGNIRHRGILVWLSAAGIALGVFACRDITAPLFAGHPTNPLNATGTVVVSPGNLRGWTLYNDQTDSACTDGAVCLFVQGPGAPPAGTGDKLTIGVSGTSTTFDFELQSRAIVPAVPPDSLPADYGDTARWVSGGSHVSGKILSEIVVLAFRRNTPQADRQAAVDLVHGTVVGGRRGPDGDGIYLVRVPTAGTIEPLFQAIATLKALPQVAIAMPEMILIGAPTSLRRSGVHHSTQPTGLIPTNRQRPSRRSNT